ASDDGPVVRAKCVTTLRGSANRNAQACLKDFLDDPATQELLRNMKSEEPTPDQEVALNAQNAYRDKIRWQKGAPGSPIADPGVQTPAKTQGLPADKPPPR